MSEDLTSPDGEPTLRFNDDEWAERLRAAVEANLTARAAKRAQRAAFNERRTYGLAARHAEKEARARNRDSASTSIPTDHRSAK